MKKQIYMPYLRARPAVHAQRCMGRSGIRSAVGAVVSRCSRWEAGNVLQRACVAMGLGGLYGGKVGIFYRPGIAGSVFRLLYRKSGGLVTSVDPSMRTRPYIIDRLQTCSEIIKHAESCFEPLVRVNFRLPRLVNPAI